MTGDSTDASGGTGIDSSEDGGSKIGSCNGRSGSGDGDAVSFVLSRMGGSELRLGSGGSLAAAASDERRRLLALLALAECAEESSDIGVRREVRRASLVRVFKRLSELLRPPFLTVYATDGAGDGDRSSMPDAE